MLWIPQRHRQAPPPLRLPWGFIPVELILSFSQEDEGGFRGGAELCCFNFGFAALRLEPSSFVAMSCLYGRTLWSGCVWCPWRRKKKSTGNEPHGEEDVKLEFCFLAWQYKITCHTALSCCLFVFFNLKLLRLAPNLCWQYTMCYSYSFWCTQKNNTQATKKGKKNPIGTKWLFFFQHFQWTFLFYIHNNTQMHKANKSLK